MYAKYFVSDTWERHIWTEQPISSKNVKSKFLADIHIPHIPWCLSPARHSSSSENPTVFLWLIQTSDMQTPGGPSSTVSCPPSCETFCKKNDWNIFANLEIYVTQSTNEVNLKNTLLQLLKTSLSWFLTETELEIITLSLRYKIYDKNCPFISILNNLVLQEWQNLFSMTKFHCFTGDLHFCVQKQAGWYSWKQTKLSIIWDYVMFCSRKPWNISI